MKTLFLIGYMGSGKTSYGRQIAEDLALPFVDLDEYIEEQEGMKIAEIFARYGEERFREIESLSLRKLGKGGNMVVATGGGTPCHPGNMEYMNSVGVTLWLNASLESLVYWLSRERDTRPLLAGISDAGLPAFITSHLHSRLPFYTQATYQLRL